MGCAEMLFSRLQAPMRYGRAAWLETKRITGDASRLPSTAPTEWHLLADFDTVRHYDAVGLRALLGTEPKLRRRPMTPCSRHVLFRDSLVLLRRSETRDDRRSKEYDPNSNSSGRRRRSRSHPAAQRPSCDPSLHVCPQTHEPDLEENHCDRGNQSVSEDPLKITCRISGGTRSRELQGCAGSGVLAPSGL